MPKKKIPIVHFQITRVKGSDGFTYDRIYVLDSRGGLWVRSEHDDWNRVPGPEVEE